MSDRRPENPMPDLFAAKVTKTPPPNVPEDLPKAEAKPTVAPASPGYMLPKDLPTALRRLSDGEIDTLLTSVTDEAKRRGRGPPSNRTTAKSPTRAKPTRPRPSQKPVGDQAPSLALGKANAVRAAFMAGVKPSTIARQFGISQSMVRQVLQAEKRKPKS
jgi:hypothetical protein